MVIFLVLSNIMGHAVTSIGRSSQNSGHYFRFLRWPLYGSLTVHIDEYKKAKRTKPVKHSDPTRDVRREWRFIEFKQLLLLLAVGNNFFFYNFYV